ncbi:MAG: hypothetical protein WAW46_02805 [Polaromonas sp.]
MGQHQLLTSIKPDQQCGWDITDIRYRLSIVVVACAALSACSALLPRGSSDTPGVFSNFKAAQAAAQRVVPLETQFSELKDMGFDPEGGANVTLSP